MKRSSYFLSFLTVVLFLLPAASVVKADGIVDPKIALGPTGTCADTTTFSQDSFVQEFTGLQTGCINDFQNNIPNPSTDGEGFTLHTLTVDVTSPFIGQISCVLNDGAPLSNATPNGSSPTSCTFFDMTLTSITPGLPYGLTFDTNFGSTVDITLVASPDFLATPEPATLLLFGTGFMAFAANKKRLRAAKSL
jgi:hypothetical protein